MEANYTKPKTKKYAAIGITAGLLLGAGGGLLMNLPGGVSAKSVTPQAISADDNSTKRSQQIVEPSFVKLCRPLLLPAPSMRQMLMRS